jgi:hypothetical protein
MATLLLCVAMVAGLCLIPLGLPGLWLMLISGVTYRLLVPAPTIAWWVIAVAVLIAAAAEVLEFTLAARYTKQYGGSRRAAWGSILGGFLGAFMGVPVPIVGPVIGAFAGAFAGALVGEWLVERNQVAARRAATGALIGRAMGVGAKAVAGCLIAVVLVAAAITA